MISRLAVNASDAALTGLATAHTGSTGRAAAPRAAASSPVQHPAGARAAPAVRVMVTRLQSILTPRTDLPFQNQPTGRTIMTIHRIHHLISILAAGACALLALAAAAPAAFAGTNPIPDPSGYAGDPYIGTAPVAPVPAATVHVSSGGMAGWQIALIAIGAALLAATAAVILDRARATRRAAAATTA
jgi:hypothetical protein